MIEKASRLHFPTLRQVPAEAEIASHRLMLRAGLVRKTASGIYCYLPLGLRALRKTRDIVRREMDAAGAQEIAMPVLQPAAIWEKSGRWEQYGPEMMRLKDRHEREFCLGPTHEEMVTGLVAEDVSSYKQLPLTLYQIAPKFRDEIRPRFGTMRLREFAMKDAYSFDADEEGLAASFRAMEEAYGRILGSIGLDYKVVAADSGLIGGEGSKEFMVLADVGEDTVIYCPACEYSANLEVARSQAATIDTDTPGGYEKVATPGMKSVAAVSGALGLPPERIVKTLVYWTENGPVAVLLRGDHTLNESKLLNRLGVEKAFLISPEDAEARGLVPGFFGPVGLPAGVSLYVDEAVTGLHGVAVGANESDAHLVNVEPGRDFPLDNVADLRLAEAGEGCPHCGAPLAAARGIEMGHVFQLGTKYSEALDATFLREDGSSAPFVMGCYGIGIDRLLAAAIEQRHDEKGIVWPAAIAPFDAHILVLNAGEEELMAAAEEASAALDAAGMDVLLDERPVSAGVKFGDADLLGLPARVNVGRSLKADGELEVVARADGSVRKVKAGDAGALVRAVREVATL